MQYFDTHAHVFPDHIVEKVIDTLQDFYQFKWQGKGIVSDLLADFRKVKEEFLTAIGVPNANTDKRERLISDEVNANNVETATRCELWLETLRKGIDKANNMFNLKLSVDWRVNPKTDIADAWTEGSEI